MMNIQLKFVDTNVDVCREFEKQFQDVPNVKVYHQRFEELDSFDCLVSPANSFGMMDGGIDAAITKFFGKQLEERVQKHIFENYFGEQPVGTSFVIETNHPDHPFLAHTPTMRTPQSIKGTTNVYYAMKAMLGAVLLYNQTHEDAIQRVACPGMGTLIGKMEPEIAVAQMKVAYEHVNQPLPSMHVPSIYKRIAEMKGASQIKLNEIETVFYLRENK